LSGIRAALQALEQTGPETSLKKALLPYFGICHLAHLKTVVYKTNFQHRIADFSKMLFEHAEQDDPVALQVVNEGAKQMVRPVAPPLKQLDFDHATIALTGALYTNVSAYYHLCKMLLKKTYPEKVHVKLGEKSILDGAIWLGEKFLEENT
jgi:N-acetylglucosamine kinase-like BadF-type ATPase